MDDEIPGPDRTVAEYRQESRDFLSVPGDQLEKVHRRLEAIAVVVGCLVDEVGEMKAEAVRSRTTKRTRTRRDRHGLHLV